MALDHSSDAGQMHITIAGTVRSKKTTDYKPVGMNIPVDPLRENSRAGGGDIHTNSIGQIS